MLISGGLALMALLATAGQVAASDPVPSEPSLTVEVTEPSEPSLTVEVTEPSEPSVTVEVTEPSEPSVTVEVPGGLPVEPVPAPLTLLAPLTELVADQAPAGAIPDADEIVATLPLDRLETPSTDALSHELLNATEDVRDVVTPLLGPALEILPERPEDAQQPTAADRSPSFSRSAAADGWGTYAADGQPVQPATALATAVHSTDIVLPLAAGCAWYPEEVLASVVVPRVAAGPGGSECSNSITDLNPFAALLAVLAAGGAGARILALRMPRSPTGIWLAAPVPPG
jgi:hypothetical protein